MITTGKIYISPILFLHRYMCMFSFHYFITSNLKLHLFSFKIPHTSQINSNSMNSQKFLKLENSYTMNTQMSRLSEGRIMQYMSEIVMYWPLG